MNFTEMTFLLKNTLKSILSIDDKAVSKYLLEALLDYLDNIVLEKMKCVKELVDDECTVIKIRKKSVDEDDGSGTGYRY